MNRGWKRFWLALLLSLAAGLACNMPVGQGTAPEGPAGGSGEVGTSGGVASTSQPAEPVATTATPMAQPSQTPTEAPTPAATPFGGSGMIAYTSREGTANADLYVAELTAGGFGQPLRLSQTLDSGWDIGAPDWHPSGQSVTVSALDYQADSSAIFTFPLDPSEPVITNFSDSSGVLIIGSLWGPGGDRFAYIAVDQNGIDSYTFRIGGAGPQPLAIGAGSQLVTDWSNNGAGLLYLETFGLSEDNPGYRANLYRLDSPGGTPRLLASNLDGVNFARFSPDGSQILYDIGVNGNQDIYVMAADGSGARPLVASPDPESSPSWSPDGQHILFTRQVAEGDRDIYLVNADGSNPRPLITGPGRQDEAVWAP